MHKYNIDLNMEKRIRKAILPAAGLGTRFLPATKASPKEMIPLVDKPQIQYAVEEANACGIDEFVIITGKHKRAIEDHFDAAYELEDTLRRAGKDSLLELINELSHINFAYIRQGAALGLGHAILRAQPFVKDEPFAVLLSDDVIEPGEPLLGNMIKLYDELQAPVIALMRVPKDEISRYGAIKGSEHRHGVYLIEDLVEKPPVEEAPSDLAIIGRYILTPDIFDILEHQPPGKGGEIQLTDALKVLATKRPLYGIVFEGKRHDAGDKLGFLKATVELALTSSQVSDEFRQFIIDTASRLQDGKTFNKKT